MARRFVEAGVRFVEITHGNWDHHNRLKTDLPERCSENHKPIAGLLKDLAQRGLLKDTLVIWGGEFGRTPDWPNGDGRDHNHKGYTTWMAGGGVKGGMSYGSTDDHGYAAAENKCHIHDWHATILHLLGPRSHASYVSLCGPGLPDDRCLRECRSGNSGLNSSCKHFFRY